MENTAAQLKQLYLLRDIDDEALSRIAAVGREENYAAGAYIYRRDEEGRFFYFILSGKIELIQQKPGEPTRVCGHIVTGGHFGEVALMTGKPRSISVRTLTETKLLAFDRDSFRNVLLANPAIHLAISRALAERLSLASEGRWQFGRNITALPTGNTAPLPEMLASSRQTAPDRTNSTEDADLHFAHLVRRRIEDLSRDLAPLLLVGETGTGRRLVAKQLHAHSPNNSSPYQELDLRQLEPWLWEGNLFGQERDSFPFTEGRQLGIFEQIDGGTVVLHHAELLSNDLQDRLFEGITTGTFKAVNSALKQPFQVRLILISETDLASLVQQCIFKKNFAGLFEKHQFTIPSLREHKRDLPTLVDFYLHHFNKEYGRQVKRISADALGLLMNYDWPGNLNELSSVIQRAVIVSSREELVSEQILLGLPRSEGRMLYNLLRFPEIRRLWESRLFPIMPKIIVSSLFCLGILVLLFGSREPTRNIGITLCWYVGWPLLIFSFFFLPRFWCSICAMSAPGKMIQKFVRPTRRVPWIITRCSAWIMAILCLVVFWVEIVWDAYRNTLLTASILLSIASGSFLFSLLFERNVWCRYLCPLGALNAVFSMPSILALRANRQLCDNQCREHACYLGTEELPGCPMFRHPFLVDNNRDCTLCGNCIKNCKLHSIQLNLRLAPEELWSIQDPRLADSFLVTTLGAVFFSLACRPKLYHLLAPLTGSIDVASVTPLTGSLVFWATALTGWVIFCLFCLLHAICFKKKFRPLASMLGYGLIPVVLGGFLAFYVRMFLEGAWRLLPNLLALFGMDIDYGTIELLSPNGTATLLYLIVLGGLVSSFYAIYRIISRLHAPGLKLRHLFLPMLHALLLGLLFLKGL